MNAFVLLTAISLALAGTSVSSSPSEGEEGAPRDGLKYREQGVSSERESADVETLEDPEDYVESEEDDDENEEDEDVSEDAENDESALETLNRKSDPLPLRFKPGTPRRVIRKVIRRLPPGRTGGMVSRGWRGQNRRGRDKRRRRKPGHCKHRRCGGIRRRPFVPARTRRRLRRLPGCCFHRYPCRNYQARRMCRG